MLQQRFDRFSQETQRIGAERVESVNAIADQLIGSGHSDAATIAEWKSGLNDSWANLLELLETRKQVCFACYSSKAFLSSNLSHNLQYRQLMYRITVYRQRKDIVFD